MTADPGGEVRQRLQSGPWRIEVTRRAGVARIVPSTRLARAMGAALEAAGAPAPSSIGLILSDDHELAELNEAHLGHEGPTDVLSFPLLGVGSFPAHEGQGSFPSESLVDAFALPPGVRPHLGDVIVSVERATAQARLGRGGQTGDVGWTPAEELLLLVVHGTLHVCGWDHAEPAEEAAMRRVEHAILEGLRSGRETRAR